MTPDTSHWRLPTRYAHLDDLNASDLAWEWLRRNDEYNQDFEAYDSALVGRQELTDKIRQQWGLRFPGRSAHRSPGSASFLAAAARHKHHCSRDHTSRVAARRSATKNTSGNVGH